MKRCAPQARRANRYTHIGRKRTQNAHDHQNLALPLGVPSWFVRTVAGMNEPVRDQVDATNGAATHDSVPKSRSRHRRVLYAAAIVAGLAATGNGGAVAVIAVILAMITIHETGHFVAAKLCRLDTPQFFVGFGPTLWSTQRGNTEYGLKAIPLGGYVKIAGMGDDLDNPHGYATANRYKKAFVAVAGPAANLATAFAAAVALLATVGLPGEPNTHLTHVVEGSPAQQAGVQPGDIITAVDGKPVNSFTPVVEAIERNSGPIQLDIDRDGTPFTATVTPRLYDGTPKIGVVADRPNETEGIWGSVAGAGKIVAGMTTESFRGIVNTASNIGNMFRGLTGDDINPDQRALSPVGAVQVGVEIGGRGAGEALSLIIAYSVFLAVFNLLPIPPLDGGHLAINAFEAVASRIKRRAVIANPNIVGRITVAFVSILILVSLTALILDITQPVLGA